MADKEKKDKPESVKVDIPPNTKFILLMETQGRPIAIRTGGFVNVDEMLGFNRRVLNPNLVEQMIIQGLQQQQQAQARKDTKEGDVNGKEKGSDTES